MGRQSAVSRALAAVAALASLAVAPPASAESSFVTDPGGDVAVFDAPPPRGGVETGPTDITGTTVRHLRARVVSFLQLDDVARRARARTTVELALVTPEASYVATLRYTDHVVSRTLTTDGRAVDCEGFHVRLNPQGDTMKLALPRPCLGRPETVRFGARVTTEVDGRTLVDDGRRREPVDSPDQPIRIGARALDQD